MKASRLHKLLFLSPQPFHLQPSEIRAVEILNAARNALTDPATGHGAAFTICEFEQLEIPDAAKWITRYAHYAKYAKSALEHDATGRRAPFYRVEEFALEWCITGRALPLQMLHAASTADTGPGRMASELIDALTEGPEPWREQFRAHLELVINPDRVANVAVTRPPAAKSAEYFAALDQIHTKLSNGEITAAELEPSIEAFFATAEPAPLVGYIFGGPQSATLYDEAKNYLGQLAPGDLQTPLELCQAADAQALPTEGDTTP